MDFSFWVKIISKILKTEDYLKLLCFAVYTHFDIASRIPDPNVEYPFTAVEKDKKLSKKTLREVISVQHFEKNEYES